KNGKKGSRSVSSEPVFPWLRLSVDEAPPTVEPANRRTPMTMKISMKPWLTMALGTVLGSLTVHAISQPDSSAPVATLLASELEGSFGSTVGPGGALYVTESAAGRISRV